MHCVGFFNFAQTLGSVCYAFSVLLFVLRVITLCLMAAVAVIPPLRRYARFSGTTLWAAFRPADAILFAGFVIVSAEKKEGVTALQYKTPGGSYYRLYFSMAQQPHLLIAGGPGSGKMAVIDGIMHTLLTNHSPILNLSEHIGSAR